MSACAQKREKKTLLFAAPCFSSTLRSPLLFATSPLCSTIKIRIIYIYISSTQQQTLFLKKTHFPFFVSLLHIYNDIGNKDEGAFFLKMGLLPPFIGAIIFCVVQFIVFLFVLVGTPTAQLTSKSTQACWTLFGAKSRCSNSKRSATGVEAFGCAHRRNNMNGGAAFAIISIFTTLAALVFGVLMLLRIPCAVLIPLILTCLSVLTILICWACVAGVHTTNMCSNSVANIFLNPRSASYGAGFGLMVTAWCLQIVNVVVLVLVSFF